MKKTYLFLWLALLTAGMNAQFPGFVWGENSGNNCIMANDKGYAVKSDASGNIYVAGTFSGSADFDPGTGIVMLSTSTATANIFLAKYNSAGACLWARSIGSFSAAEMVNDMVLDASGNAYITGFFNSTADFDPSLSQYTLTSYGSNDIFIAKYDASGNFVFANNVGGTSADVGKALRLDPSGNICLTGYYSGTCDFDPSPSVATLTSASTDGFLARYNASGNYIWAGKIGGPGIEDVGAIFADASGNQFITGYFSNTCDFDPSPAIFTVTASGGSVDMFFAKYDNTGNFQWVRKVDGASTEIGRSIAVDGSGNIYVAGTFQGTVDFNPGAPVNNLISAGSDDIFIAKYDNLGNYVFANKIGAATVDRGNSITVDASNNIYVTGYFTGTVDFDPGAPVMNLVSSGAANDVFFAKYTSAGAYVFAYRAGSAGADEGNQIALDPSGNILITGLFSSTVDFDPGPSNNSETSNYGDSFFISKYSSAGNYSVSFCTTDAGGGIGAWAITADASGNAYVAGTCNGPVDIDPGPGVAIVSWGMFVQKLTSSGAFVWVVNTGNVNCTPADISVDGSGNIYVTGVFTGTVDFDPGPGTYTLNSLGAGNDVYVLKLDASGTFVWARAYGGGFGVETPMAMRVDATGNVYTTGYFAGTTDLDPGPAVLTYSSAGATDYYLSKIDPSGNLVFGYKFGNTTDDQGRGLCLDAAGNIYTTGTFGNSVDFDPGPGNYFMLPAGGGSNGDVFIHKLSPTGNFLMAIKLGGVNTGDHGYSIAVDPSGNILTAGIFSVTGDFDPGPTIYNITNVGSWDIFVSKLSPSGSFIWAKSIGGSNADYVTNVGTDPAGNVFIQGQFGSWPCDFDPGPGSYPVSPNGAADVYVQAMNSSGNFMWMRNVGGTNYDDAYSGYVDPAGNIYSAGYISSMTNSMAVDVDPSGSTYNLIADASDFYAFKWSQCSPLGSPGSINGAVTVCAGSSNTYSIAPMGGATSYSWNLPGGWTGTSTTNIITTTAGISGGVITAYGINACGVSPSSTIAISIGSIPSTPGAISGSVSLCAGASAVYSISPVPGATSYSWNLPGGWTGSSGTNTINATSGSTGVFSVSASNACGTSGTQTLNVTVNPSPTVTIGGGSSTVCAGTQVNLTASGASTYSWSTGAVTNTISPSPTITTAYTVTGTSAGCSGNAVKTITVNPLPSLTITGTASVCIGNSATLTASGAVTYTWSTGSNSGTITPSPTVNTTYSLSGTNANGCTNSVTTLVTVNGLPTVTINGPNFVCMNSAVSLTAAGANTYNWNTGALTATIAPSPTINTTYTVIGTSIAGCSNTAVKSVTVNALPVVSINSSTNVICNGASVLLTANGANTYSWSTGALTNTISATPSVTTTYNVTGTGLNSCSNTAVVNISVNPLPNVTANASSTLVCSGSTVSLTGGGANTYTWSGGISNGVQFSPTVTASYTVTGTSLAGCTNTAAITITVSNIPQTPLAISGPSALCVGAPATVYSITPVSGATGYVWTLPAGWSGSGSSNSISATPGVNGGNILVYASNTCGSSSPQTLSVTIHALPSVTASGNPLAVCPADGVTLTAGGASTYSWSTGAVTPVTTVNPLTTTIYTVTGTNSVGCASYTTITIGVFSSPTITAASSSSMLCVGESATLTAGGANSYTWNPGGMGASIVVNPTVTSSYTVTGTNGSGCTNTSVFTQSVSACLGINKAGNPDNQFIVYPNPTSGVVILNSLIAPIDSEGFIALEVYNSLGQLAITSSINGSETEIDLNRHAKGIYFVRIVSEKYVITKRIVKE